MTFHYGAAASGDAGKGGRRLWGRLKQSFTRSTAETDAGIRAAAIDEVAMEEPPGREGAFVAPPLPDDLPISEADYGLMRMVLVRQQNSALVSQCYAHAIAVARWCVSIADRRGLNAHTACMAGFLHDAYYYATGLRPLHAQNSAEQVGTLFGGYASMTDEEKARICRAIFGHHDETTAHEPYSELLRDAHMLCDYAEGRDVRCRDFARLSQLAPEWGMAAPLRSHVVATPEPVYQGSRAALAEVAQTLAAQRISWYEGESDALTICQYWPEQDAFEQLAGRWSAAFVYHCCYEAGFILPIHAPQVQQRFTEIKGWLEFASLLNNGFYHPTGESGFVPERGDIVVFDRLMEDKQPADHIGVVVMTSPDHITVAEGNARLSNVSDVIVHSATHHVRGYIRLPNDYRAERPFN